MNAVTPVEMSTDDLGKHIRARIVQGDKAAGKAEDHYTAAGIHLKEARERIAKEGGSFDDFLKQYDIGRSRAYDLLAVADGKKTFAGIRAKAAERAARHAEKNRVARESVSNGPAAPDDKASTELAEMLFMLAQANQIESIASLIERADGKIVAAELRKLAAPKPVEIANPLPPRTPVHDLEREVA
jgi:hypothetical protein